jgi:hypothetical protein
MSSQTGSRAYASALPPRAAWCPVSALSIRPAVPHAVQFACVQHRLRTRTID